MYLNLNNPLNLNKMKRINYIACGMVMAWMLAACQSEEEGNSRSIPTATFVATIDPQVNTRAADTQWDASDAIGITGQSGEVKYLNIAHTTTAGDGKFSLVDADNEIYYNDEETVTFTAYYPWTTDISSPIAFSTANQSQQKSFDFLFGTGTGSAESPLVNIAFRHVMSKMVFTLKPTDEFTLQQLKATEMTMKGLIVGGTFDALTGEVTVDTDATDLLEVDNNAPGTERATELAYTLILPPQQVDEPVTLSFTSEGVTFTTQLTLPDQNQLLLGTEYDVNITLRRQEAVIEGCTITDWTKKQMEDCTAEL
jgi:hypothetical protein